jgi:excinuclease ABC subunit B
MSFILVSQFKPSGDQPQAIEKLARGLGEKKRFQTLLGVTGSGKTFTMANVIARLDRPALVLSHNKTLAAQLYEEFREFFPENAVHYFVSYYDYYQPEAYLPNTDTYIEKDSKINAFIDELRHASTQAALTRRDLIIVASVSAIYGLGEPEEYLKFSFEISRGQHLPLKKFTERLAHMQYRRNDIERAPGTWAQKGEIVTVLAPAGDTEMRVHFFNNEIEEILEGAPYIDTSFQPKSAARIFPAKHFMTPDENIKAAIRDIEQELAERIRIFKKENKPLEAERIARRTRYDIKMLAETGYTTGIENYSRHLSRRAPGSAPATLLDYLPHDFITLIDESHMTIPQIRGMSAGDRARKQTLVDYGFRLPSALDNRPLTFNEFEHKIGETIFVSATPAEYEIARGNITEQLVRPTGLLDPTIEVRPATHQVSDTEKEITLRAAKKEPAGAGGRTLVITLTKRMAEDISEFLTEKGLRVAWLHSEIKTIERSDILRNLRMGTFDAIVGINLLREGLDLPEVSLICILDADKEGFLRNATTLIQTVGRASRHIAGHVIFYADTITNSMKKAIDETARRRKYQEEFNIKHGITPQPLKKEIRASLFEGAKKLTKKAAASALEGEKRSSAELKREIEKEMLEAAAELNFEKAAELRDLLKTI